MEVLDVLVQVVLAKVGACAALYHTLEWPLPSVCPLVTLECLAHLEEVIMLSITLAHSLPPSSPSALRGLLQAVSCGSL